MAARVATKRPAPFERAATPDTGDLVRRLVRALDRADSANAPVVRREENALEEIVFETEIDGLRYVLTRSRPKATNIVNLSPRELAVAQLIAKGLPNKSIGDILEISPWTVATHLRRIFVKLDVTSRAAMVARLGEANLL
jgi:two-component system, NarL family, nitrate/nitrite response regulator NarL